MKKFLIGVICIIPIVVVLALSVTSNIILATTPPNPQSLEIRNSENEIVSEDDMLVVDISNRDEFIIIDIFPTITPDKSIEYERNEEAGEGLLQLEKIENSSNRYRIIPLKAGVTQITVSAKKNVNIYKTLTIHITTDSVEQTSLYNSIGERVVGEYKLMGEERFYLDANPIIAMSASGVEWRVSHSDIVRVDKNGIVSPLKEGLAELEAMVRDRAGDVHYERITLNTVGAVAKTSELYTANALGINEIKAKVAVNPEKTDITDLGNNRYRLTRTDTGAEREIEVRSCAAGEIGFISAPSVMYTNNGPCFVSCGYVESGSGEGFNAVYSSDTPDLIDVSRDGVVTPLKPGKAVVRATYEGGYSQTEILIKERPVAFELKHRSADGRLGIQMNRVWGLYWLTEDYALTTSFDFGIRNDQGTFDLNWSISAGAEYAEITRKEQGKEDITITFNENAAGRKVTVSAVLVVDNREINGVRRSFTFNIQPKKESVNVYNFDQLARVLSPHEKYGGQDYNCYDCVMQSDIYATDIITESSAGIYGNGFLYDGSTIPKDGNDGVKYRFGVQGGMIRYCYEDAWCHNAIMDYTRTHKDVFEANKAAGIPYTEYTLDYVDIVMRGAETLEAASYTENNVTKTRNAALYLEEVWNEISTSEKLSWDRPPKVNLKFLQISNTVKGVELEHITDTLVEGCIMGDNRNHSIFATYYGMQYRKFADGSNLTLRNNVFKMSEGPAVALASPAVEMDFDANAAPTLKVEGLCAIYNWKTREQFSNMLADFVLGYITDAIGADEAAGAIVNLMKGPFRNTIGSVIEDEELDYLFFNYSGNEYIPFGILGTGAIFTWDPYPDGPDGKCLVDYSKSQDISMTEFRFRDKNGKTLGTLASLESMLLNLLPKFDSDIKASSASKPSYLISNDFSSGAPAIAPGDPVPNSKELYDKLTQGV